MPTTTCPACSTLLDEGDLFCQNCGASTLPTYSRVELQRLGDAETAESDKSAWWGSAIGLGAGLLLSLVALIVVGTAPFDNPIANQKWWFQLFLVPWVTLAFGASLGAIVGFLRSTIRKRRTRTR